MVAPTEFSIFVATAGTTLFGIAAWYAAGNFTGPGNFWILSRYWKTWVLYHLGTLSVGVAILVYLQISRDVKLYSTDNNLKKLSNIVDTVMVSQAIFLTTGVFGANIIIG